MRIPIFIRFEATKKCCQVEEGNVPRTDKFPDHFVIAPSLCSD